MLSFCTFGCKFNRKNVFLNLFEKSTCQCDSDLYNAPSLTRERFEKNGIELARSQSQAEMLEKSLKKV